jgi:hypothetical protein
MPVSFEGIEVGETYSRNKLAELWGYSGFQALARGVVTPRNDNKIVLFVTHEKQSAAEQYEDELAGGLLHWEGPTDHFAEGRMLSVTRSVEEIHLFYRERHHSDFVYEGQLQVVSCAPRVDGPSRFVFKLI